MIFLVVESNMSPGGRVVGSTLIVAAESSVVMSIGVIGLFGGRVLSAIELIFGGVLSLTVSVKF